jgi:hypothetical protein
MKTKLVRGFLAVLALAFLVSPHSARAGTILWDDSHDTDSDELSGNFSAFAATMATAGHTLVELNGSAGAITPAALSGFDAFFLWDAETALTSSEITTLQNFVAAGGGLFVAYDVGTHLASNNALLAPYGLSLSTTASAASVSGFVPHPVTAGITTVDTALGGIVGTTGSAIDLTLANGSNNILAVSAGPQRVVVFGDTDTFKTRLANVDNRALVINIANYTAAPEPASLAILAMAGFAALFLRLR